MDTKEEISKRLVTVLGLIFVLLFVPAIKVYSEGWYNTYISCSNRSTYVLGIGGYTQTTISFDLQNSGDKTIYITKLIIKNRQTNEILMTSTDSSVLGELQGGNTKCLSFVINFDYKEYYPELEIVYTLDNKEYSYDDTQYVVLSITANKFGMVQFMEVPVGEDIRRFSVKPGGDAALVFVPNEGCVLSKVSVNETEITMSIVDNKYTIANMTSSTSVNAVFDAVSGNRKSINGHEYVDLGLPSGSYWSMVNYGAKNPEDAGSYMSYKDLSTVSNNWGEYWRLPTKEEMQELIDVCEWTWTEKNGTNGFYIKGPNGNFMFLPAGGKYYVDAVNSVGSDAYYFTSDTQWEWDYWMFVGNSSEKSISVIATLMEKYPVRPISTVKNEAVFSTGGLNFSVISANDKTANLAKGNYGKVLEVPSTVKYPNTEWMIVGIDQGALSESNELAAVIWNPDALFTEKVDNPNLLLYVKSASFAPTSIKNVVVNGAASSIVLSETSDRNSFYCPQAFTAKEIRYTHHYKMETGLGNARGWETIALPFEVQRITHQDKGEIVPFANWKSGDAKKPFWLMTYGNSGWTEANSIKANTPYIISMPNHSNYKPEYQLNGNVTFSAENVIIPVSENMHSVNYNGKTFVPNYINQSDNSYYALNVNNDFVTYSGSEVEGSKFLIGLRGIHPFEAYMTTATQTRGYIAISEDMTTGIRDITKVLAKENPVRVYNLNGQLIMAEENKSIDDITSLLSAGVYIVNGKKLIIK